MKERDTVPVIQLVYKPPTHKSKEGGEQVRRHSNLDSHSFK